MIAVEQLEKAGLGPRRPFDAAEAHRGDPMQELFGIEREILHPERRALPDGGELCRLEVRVREAGEGAIPPRLLGKRDEHGANPPQEEDHRLPHQEQVGVVGDERARRAQVDVGSGGRSLIAEVVDMRHDVVAQAPLVLGGLVEISVVEVRPQLRERGIGNFQPELFLGFHQRQPQPAPQTDATALAPERLHGRRRVPCRERRNPVQTAAFARATSLLQSARN